MMTTPTNNRKVVYRAQNSSILLNAYTLGHMMNRLYVRIHITVDIATPKSLPFVHACEFFFSRLLSPQLARRVHCP